MSDPRPELAAWLSRFHPGAGLQSLAGDASTRRFFRIRPAVGPTSILMDYGAPFEGETDDMRLTAIFRNAGLPVAAIRDVVTDPGCLVLEDLGDRMLQDVLLEADDEGEKWFSRAVDLIVTLVETGTPALAGSSRSSGPALDDDRFRFEMDFFLDHFVGAYIGCRASDRARGLLHELAVRAADTPRRVLCHRDYHSRNLMIHPNGSLAMVDIQDARWGPLTYDLASLLYDAYIVVPDVWVERSAESFRAALSQPIDSETFRARLGVVACQRMLKALGTFGYQIAVLGRSRYRGAIPRTVRRLRRLLPINDSTRALATVLEDEGLLGGLSSVNGADR